MALGSIAIGRIDKGIILFPVSYEAKLECLDKLFLSQETFRGGLQILNVEIWGHSHFISYLLMEGSQRSIKAVLYSN